jgi:hypothetical protein
MHGSQTDHMVHEDPPPDEAEDPFADDDASR